MFGGLFAPPENQNPPGGSVFGEPNNVILLHLCLGSEGVLGWAACGGWVEYYSVVPRNKV